MHSVSLVYWLGPPKEAGYFPVEKKWICKDIPSPMTFFQILLSLPLETSVDFNRNHQLILIASLAPKAAYRLSSLQLMHMLCDVTYYK